MPDFTYEIRFGRQMGKIVCGVDEVGRGPLAGPVVTAAVILASDFPEALCAKIKDSKKMTPAAREKIVEPLKEHCLFSLAQASVEEIDQLNILHATMLAMQRAVEDLGAKIDVALIDGNRAPDIPCQAVPVVKGDGTSLSIAAASIIAKVHRDRLMASLAKDFPFYGWERNAGYGTAEHIQALKAHGATVHHRQSFAPVREVLQKSA
ncbi:MAG: ribonuclease HII [Alphaproteobacteria bacterium]|nr:ribonuclease HII [Alphaproteobacteria bacterium]